MDTAHGETASIGMFIRGGTPARDVRELAMTPEASDFLADLSHKTGLREGEVIRLALGMLKAAVDAKEQGKHVGIAETSDALDTEFVGF